MIGGCTGLIFMAWMCVKAQLDKISGAVVYLRKPYTTTGCNYTFPDLAALNLVAENITETLEEAR